MSRIHYIKNVPMVVKRWFERNYNPQLGFTFKFYSYQGKNGRIFGCFVSKNGQLFSYSHQATEYEFANMPNLQETI